MSTVRSLVKLAFEKIMPTRNRGVTNFVSIPASEIGEWPEDLDEVPRWRLMQEQRAELMGYEIPSYRTRRDFEEAVRDCEAKFILEKQSGVSVPPKTVELPVELLSSTPGTEQGEAPMDPNVIPLKRAEVSSDEHKVELLKKKIKSGYLDNSSSRVKPKSQGDRQKMCLLWLEQHEKAYNHLPSWVELKRKFDLKNATASRYHKIARECLRRKITPFRPMRKSEKRSLRKNELRLVA